MQPVVDRRLLLQCTKERARGGAGRGDREREQEVTEVKGGFLPGPWVEGCSWWLLVSMSMWLDISFAVRLPRQPGPGVCKGGPDARRPASKKCDKLQVSFKERHKTSNLRRHMLHMVHKQCTSHPQKSNHEKQEPDSGATIGIRAPGEGCVCEH